MFLQIKPGDFPTLGRFVDVPSCHPDFLACNHPRLENYEARYLPVYVPSLVELVHRLGGIENIPDSGREREFCSSMILADTENEIEARAEVVRWVKGDTTELWITQWHPNRDMFLLEVHFSIPERWAAGDWQVGYVADQDIIAATDAIRLEIARLCNRAVGMRLADPLHAVRKRRRNQDPLVPSRILRPTRRAVGMLVD